MTQRIPKFQDVGARLLCVWGVAWGCYGLTIPEPFVRVFGFTLAVVCGAAVFMPRVMPSFVIWFSALMGVLSMFVGVGLAGAQGLAVTGAISLLVLGPPVFGAMMLNRLHSPKPPTPGVCPKCGYSLAGSIRTAARNAARRCAAGGARQ